MKDKEYYESLDKRTKEYKDYKASLSDSNELEKESDSKTPKKKSEGLGDTLEKVFEATGIKKAVEFLMDGKDCKCEERKEKLNELFRYEPKCLVKREYDFLNDFNERRNEKRIEKADVRTLIVMHRRVFGARHTPKVCTNCSSGMRTMNRIIDNLNKLLSTYENV